MTKTAMTTTRTAKKPKAAEFTVQPLITVHLECVPLETVALTKEHWPLPNFLPL